MHAWCPATDATSNPLIASALYGPVSWMTGVYLLIAFVLVLANGFFVLAEFAIVKVRATRLEELARQGNKRAEAAQDLLRHLERYLSTAQLGITIASLALGWVGEPAFASLVHTVIGRIPWSSGTSHILSMVASFGIITFLHILLGEQAPKLFAIRNPEICSLAVAQPMRWSYAFFFPFMVVLNGASNLILKLVRLPPASSESVHTEQELKMLLSTAQSSGGFSLNRLLILENIFDLGSQTVREAMIPWEQVRFLRRSWGRTELLRELFETRYSRYPVVEESGPPRSYLLMKDLIILSQQEEDWRRILRPLRPVSPDDNLEITMQQLQRDGANMAVVVDSQRAIGIITLEDILEEVVGRIEDEYPRLPRIFLKDALAAGGIVLNLKAETSEEAIRELAAVIPPNHLPPDVDAAEFALARERQMSTDMGLGIAIPHARIPRLSRSLLVFGRSSHGIVFNQQSGAKVQLVFLLVTPLERPQSQVFFLAQLASVTESEFVRERLYRAQTEQDLLETIAAADPAVTG